jgi:hypothetical protein
LCDFPEDGYGGDWEPSDLPDLWKAWLEAEGIAHLDLTVALKAAAADGNLVYFADDGHSMQPVSASQRRASTASSEKIAGYRNQGKSECHRLEPKPMPVRHVRPYWGFI